MNKNDVLMLQININPEGSKTIFQGDATTESIKQMIAELELIKLTLSDQLMQGAEEFFVSQPK